MRSTTYIRPLEKFTYFKIKKNVLTNVTLFGRSRNESRNNALQFGIIQNPDKYNIY